MAGTAIGFLIAGACLSLTGNVHEACSKAAEAGAKQTGIEQNLNNMEKGIERIADRKAVNLIGEKGMGIAGGGIFIAKAVRDKSIILNLPTLGICNKIITEVGSERSELTLMWGF